MAKARGSVPTTKPGIDLSRRNSPVSMASSCFIYSLGMRLRLRGGSPHVTTSQDDAKFSSDTRPRLASNNLCMDEMTLRVRQFMESERSREPRQVLHEHPSCTLSFFAHASTCAPCALVHALTTDRRLQELAFTWWAWTAWSCRDGKEQGCLVYVQRPQSW
jgi:hypothetical protein